MSGALSSYATRHLQALFGALGRLARTPLATILTLTVIGVALSLPAGLGLLVNNLRSATGELSNALDFTVFFKAGTPIERAQQIATSARERSGIDSVTVKSAEQALQEFKTASGFGDALSALADNPLPHHLIVRPNASASGPAEVETLRRYFSASPEVDLVQLDLDWVRRLHSLLDLLRRVFWVVVAILGLGVLAVIGNTIRLEIQHRRQEIEVTKLVGGSNAFVQANAANDNGLYIDDTFTGALRNSILHDSVNSLASFASAGQTTILTRKSVHARGFFQRGSSTDSRAGSSRHSANRAASTALGAPSRIKDRRAIAPSKP